MARVVAELDLLGLEKFKAKYRELVVTQHPNFSSCPLLLLHHQKSFKTEPVVEPLVEQKGRKYKEQKKKEHAALVQQCCGLIVASAVKHVVVAKGFDKFVEEKSDGDIFSVATKEEGELVLLYNYGGRWMLSGKRYFVDDATEQLFKRTILKPGESKDGKDLETKFQITCSALSPDYTYLFEMCSPRKSCLYLLDCVRLSTLKVLEVEEYDFLVKTVSILPGVVLWTTTHPTLTSWKLIHESFKTADPTFPGYVVTMKTGCKVVVKNPIYSLLHKLKIGSWMAATPAVLLPLLTWPGLKLEPMTMLRNLFVDDTKSFQEIEYLINLYTSAPSSGQKLIMDSAVQSFDSRYHYTSSITNKYCAPPNLPPKTNVIYFDELDEGLGVATNRPEQNMVDKSWKVVCACGGNMTLTRLQRNHVVPSFCHCGKRNGIYKVDAGKFLYLCDSCGSTHECYQEDMSFASTNSKITVTMGTPLGIPCSPNTKIYRLHLHHLMDQIWCFDVNRGAGGSKSKMYYHLSKLMNLTTEQCHVAKFTKWNCYRALYLLTIWQQLTIVDIPSEIKHVICSYVQ